VPNGVALAVAAFFLLFGLLALRRAVDQARLIKTLRALEPVGVRDPGPALRLVRGTLDGQPLLQSPYQARPCLYYFFRVLEPRPSGAPRVLATGKEWTLATVSDPTGTAAIEPWTAVVASPRRFEASHENLKHIPPELATFFERAGIDEKHLPRLRSFVVHEYTLEPGDTAYVLGTLDPTPPRLYRAKRRPLVVSSERDIGLLATLKNELLLFAILAPLLLAAAVAVALVAALA